MSGNDHDWYERTVRALTHCDELESDATMRSLFGHPRLKAFADGLPQSASVRARVLAVVNHLQDKQTRAGENALAELLRVLSALYADVALGETLAGLAEAVAAHVGKSREDAKAQRKDPPDRRGDPHNSAKVRRPVVPVAVPRVPASGGDRPVAPMAALYVPAQIAWVHVPAGAFIMGSEKDSDEKPVHPVYLDDYWIAQTPVTVAQFARFVKATGYVTADEQDKDKYTWRTPRGSGSNVLKKKTHPVTCVTWDDAQAFCAWLSKEIQQDIALPTEAEWEKAAHGTYQRVYPWGDAFDKTRCNVDKSGVRDTTPVERYGALGASPYGVWDMAGNVWEWCADWYGAGYYKRAPQANPTGPKTGRLRVLRGGSWGSTLINARASCRNWGDPLCRDNIWGFRVVCRALPPF